MSHCTKMIKNYKNMLANPRKVLGAHMKMGMAMRSLHGGAAETRGTPRVCSEPHPRARLCSDGGFSCYFQNYHPLEKLWNLPHRCRSSWKWSTVAGLVVMLPPKQCFPPQDSPSASPEPLWTRVRSEHPQTLHPPAHLPLKSLLSGCDIGATPAPH